MTDHPKPLMRRAPTLYHIVNGVAAEGPNDMMRGDCSDLRGNCTYLRGYCAYLRGDCTGLRGNCSGLHGDLDDIPAEARPARLVDFVADA